ncbi:MAG TPA: IclR family transcriptional regulator [Nevskiaceae bacterium]
MSGTDKERPRSTRTGAPRTRGRPRTPPEHSEEVRIKSVERALQVIKALAAEPDSTLKIVAVNAELPSSTAFRVLETLRAHGVVEFNEAKQTWNVGVEAFRIGQSYARRVGFIDVGRAVMHELTDRTGETSSIAILDRSVMIYVSQVQSASPIRAFIPPTTRAPLHASAIGKVVLSYMDADAARQRLQADGLSRFTAHTVTDVGALLGALAQIRRNGWALDDEERYAGMRCVAAAIFDEFSQPIAGISISGPVERLADDRVAKLASPVIKAARMITYRSGGQWPR